MATYEEISGVFVGARWISPDSDYVIGTLDSGDTVKGPCQPGELIVNQPYRFVGNWKPPQNGYGKSFAFVCAVRELPHTRAAIVEYLLRSLRGHATGIGEATANLLYSFYQGDAIRQLRTNPREVAKRIKLSLEKCERAAMILEGNAKLEDTKIELVGLFEGKGFPRDTIAACIDRWKIRAPGIIKRDAFVLLTARIPGCGFLRVDQLYLGLGGNPARLKRQMFACLDALKRSENTWDKIETAERAITDKIAGYDTDPKRAIELGRRAKYLSVTSDGQFVAEQKKAENESTVATCVRKMAAPTQWPKIESSRLTDHQRKELDKALTSRIGILAGTPGTGKTFTAAAVVEAIIKSHGLGAIEVCAPTGKASSRISKTMQDKYGLPIQGKTIHRLLLPSDSQKGHSEGDWRFAHNRHNPLDARFILVDESSMIDVNLMASLLDAVHLDAKILLIGDPYQLPPVGHGAPLRDMISSEKIGVGTLSEIKRNSGMIVQACRQIKDGTPFTWTQQFEADNPENNLMLRHTTSPAATISWLCDFLGAVREQGKRDVIEDVQIIVGLNDRSDLSRKKLNPLIQKFLNPGEQSEGSKYRVGDKVICLTNGKYPDVEKSTNRHALFNGEQGRVIGFGKSTTLFSFPDAGDGFDRNVEIPDKGEIAESFDLAYAITCHKSQGSDWPIAIVLVDESAHMVASREWWYTAISRAKDKCLILGSPSVMSRQCQRVTLRDRKTFLTEMLSREESSSD